MNRLAIFNLLALFCTSFAPAQAEFEKYRRVKAVRMLIFNSIMEESTRWFDSDDVYLYRDVNRTTGKIYYKAVEDSRRHSKKFLIDQRSTVVTKDGISLGYEEDDEPEKYAIDLTLNGDTFDFYQDIFSFQNSNKKLDATRINRLWVDYDITAIKAKKGPGGDWSFAAVAGDKPCLIFPMCRMSSIANKMAESKVTFSVREKVNLATPYTVEFASPSDADKFYQFLTEIW